MAKIESRDVFGLMSEKLPINSENRVTKATPVTSGQQTSGASAGRFVYRSSDKYDSSNELIGAALMELRVLPFLLCGLFFLPQTSGAQETPSEKLHFLQAVEEADPALAALYGATNGKRIWTGSPEADRRRLALIAALERADAHGLPTESYRIDQLFSGGAETLSANELDFALSAVFLKYAEDLSTGLLEPSKVDREIKRLPGDVDAAVLGQSLMTEPAATFFDSLPPSRSEYRGLMRARATLLAVISDGGWGETVPGKRYEIGDQSDGVAALRQRLDKLGFDAPSMTDPAIFDAPLDAAVKAFQTANGLTVDGIAGPVTLGEINRSAAERLGSVLVALERERWLPRDLGERHVEVNIPGFTARLKQDGATIFETRAVTGKNRSTHRTPEFSDEMEYMVVNPTWNVPRSITTREYLPKLQQNPAAVGHLTLTDRQGQPIDRATIDFASFDASSFPYRLKQRPGTGNALGRVKFMFPNQYNIYLHDTPQKALFARESRAYSHGCIRLADPSEFAVALLTPQSEAPEALFQKRLDTGRESRITLQTKLPVHLIYRTARVTPDGQMIFRRDVYGRDAKILDALIDAGVPAGSGES